MKALLISGLFMLGLPAIASTEAPEMDQYTDNGNRCVVQLRGVGFPRSFRGNTMAQAMNRCNTHRRSVGGYCVVVSNC